MVPDYITAILKPKCRQAVENLALIGYQVVKNHVKSRNLSVTIMRHIISYLIHIPDLAPDEYGQLMKFVSRISMLFSSVLQYSLV